MLKCGNHAAQRALFHIEQIRDVSRVCDHTFSRIPTHVRQMDDPRSLQSRQRAVQHRLSTKRGRGLVAAEPSARTADEYDPEGVVAQPRPRGSH